MQSVYWICFVVIVATTLQTAGNAISTFYRSPFFKKWCTSSCYINGVVLYQLSYPILSRNRSRTCAWSCCSNQLSYPVLPGEGVEPSTHNVVAGIPYSNNSIQIVTTSALLCFKTLTWFACCRCIPVLPLSKLLNWNFISTIF